MFGSTSVFEFQIIWNSGVAKMASFLMCKRRELEHIAGIKVPFQLWRILFDKKKINKILTHSFLTCYLFCIWEEKQSAFDT